VSDAADRLVAEVRKLLDSGVRPNSIIVVGASMGASITLLASTRLAEPDVRFAVLGACLTENTRWLERDGHKQPQGRILAIRDASDDLDGPCPAFRDDPDARDGLIAREIVIDTGLSHGFLYRPLPDWVEPVVQFARAREAR
jgi:pimeloyl-ACP methyl ester carboxylesterase